MEMLVLYCSLHRPSCFLILSSCPLLSSFRSSSSNRRKGLKYAAFAVAFLSPSSVSSSFSSSSASFFSHCSVSLSLSLSLTIVPNCKAVHTWAPQKKESDYFPKIESKLQCHAHGSVQLAPCLQRVALSSI